RRGGRGANAGCVRLCREEPAPLRRRGVVHAGVAPPHRERGDRALPDRPGAPRAADRRATRVRGAPGAAADRRSRTRLRSGAREAAGRRARDLRAARRRGLQAPRDCVAAGDFCGHVQGAAPPGANDVEEASEMTDLWTDRLSEYLDGELESAERLELERHLASCGACATALEDLREVAARAASLPVR